MTTYTKTLNETTNITDYGGETGTKTVQSSQIYMNKENILEGKLTAETSGTNNSNTITFYLSNDGGSNWHQVTNDENFVFPTTGQDLRWKAKITRKDPSTMPKITKLLVDFVT